MHSILARYRPVFAADGAAGGAAAPDAAAAVADAAASPAGADAAAAAAAAAAPAADAPADAGKAPAASDAAAAAAAPKSEPSLLEAASGKKPDGKAADAPASDARPEGDKPAADAPAPADAAKPDAAKPADAKDDKSAAPAAEKPKDDAAKPDPAKDATAEPQPPAPVKYEAFKVPDGIKLDEKKLGQFTEIIGGAQVKQEVAQSLMDLYVAERQADATSMAAEQRRVWNALNDGWKSELRKDSVLGGNRLETSLSMAKAVIEEYGGSPEQVKDLLAHTSNNGMGNYPGFVRLLHNIGVAMNVFEDSIVPANPTAPKTEKGPGKRGWYPSMGNGQAT